MKAIELFAGAGGGTTGAMMAGVKVVWAANHWKDAVDYHKLNHPKIQHSCQDLQQADWSLVPSHDLMIASPSCTGFTKARGKDRPHHDNARSTAWAVVSCAEFHKPEVAIIENVPEFADWILYPAWKMAMESLGYSLAPHIVDAADHGVPQNRVRLFIVCTRSKNPLTIRFEPQEHVSAQVDWEFGRWSLINKPGRAKNTLTRIQNGRAAFGDRFLIPYYKSSKTGRDPNRPLGTITTKDRWALVKGDHMRMLTVDEYKACMGFPSDYRLPKQKELAVHMIGNAVCPPVMRDFCNQLKKVA